MSKLGDVDVRIENWILLDVSNSNRYTSRNQQTIPIALQSYYSSSLVAPA
jgi:hypothetical protein